MIQSYPLIGVDRNGKEHTFEREGHSKGQAAERLLQDRPDLIQVLNGDKKACSANNHFRQPIPIRKGMTTSLGEVFAEAKQAEKQRNLETAWMVIGRIERGGFKLFCVEGDEGLEIRSTPVDRELTAEDIADIEAHRDPIIEALKNRPQPEKPPKKKRGRPKVEPQETQLELKAPEDDLTLFREILPDLPAAFQAYDLERCLRKRREHAIADDSARVTGILEQATQAGLITSSRPGSYAKPPVRTEKPAEPISPVQTPPPPPTSELLPKLPVVPDGGFQAMLSSLITNALASGSAPSTADTMREGLRRFENGVMDQLAALIAVFDPIIRQKEEEEALRKALRDGVLNKQNS